MVPYSTKANNLGMKTYKNHDKSCTMWLIPERISWVKSSQRWASHFQLWKEELLPLLPMMFGHI